MTRYFYSFTIYQWTIVDSGFFRKILSLASDGKDFLKRQICVSSVWHFVLVKSPGAVFDINGTLIRWKNADWDSDVKNPGDSFLKRKNDHRFRKSFLFALSGKFGQNKSVMQKTKSTDSEYDLLFTCRDLRTDNSKDKIHKMGMKKTGFVLTGRLTTM